MTNALSPCHKKISDCTVSPIADQAWRNGYAVHLFSIDVYDGDTKLVENRDYTVRYRSDTAVGQARAIIEGAGDYFGTIEKAFTIEPAPLSSVAAEPLSDYTVTGSPIMPDVTLSYNGADLAKDLDYTLSYRNNVAPGIGHAVVAAKGNFEGELDLGFRIFAAWNPTFTDVDPAAWYAEPIATASSLGLVNGYTDENGRLTGIFAPDANMTRGQAAIILARAAGVDLGSAKDAKNSTSFEDNLDGMYYTSAVNRAYEQGILGGYTGTSLVRPDNEVSRQEFAVMLARWVKLMGVDTSNASLSVLYACADWAQVADWAVSSLAWATDEGIVRGQEIDGKSYVAPNLSAARSEMATMVVRAINAVYGLPSRA